MADWLESCLDALKDWQALISGLLALVAGTFVLIDGREKARIAEKHRQQDRDRERRAVHSHIKMLYRKCSDLLHKIDEHADFREDFQRERLEDASVYPPNLFHKSRIFEACFDRLSTAAAPEAIVINLADLLDKLSAFELAYDRYYKFFHRDIHLISASRRQSQLFEDADSLNNERLLIDGVEALSEFLKESAAKLQEEMRLSFADLFTNAGKSTGKSGEENEESVSNKSEELG